MSQKRCCYCGKKEALSGHLFEGEREALICDECIKQFSKILEQHDQKTMAQDIEAHFLKPKEIATFLDQYVISQQEAKIALSIAIYSHYKRIATPSKKDVELEKSNILLLGSSGSGKTLLAKTVAKILDVPFAMADSTALTEAGYVGEDVESILSRLLAAADYDIQKAQKGIVYIDEIDKLAKKSESAHSGRDISGEGVQQGLLRILEGAEVYVPLKGARKNSNTETTLFDTTHVLFICGGAFVGLQESTKESRASGFLASQTHLPNKPIAQRLIKYGMIPEFIGRIPVIIELKALEISDLILILTEPKNSIIKQYQHLFSLDGVALEFTPEALESIAKKALDEALGARGLRHILEEIVRPLLFESPSNPKLSKIIIHAHREPELLYKRKRNAQSL